MLVQAQWQGECRSQANLCNQQYYGRLIFGVEDQDLVGQQE